MEEWTRRRVEEGWLAEVGNSAEGGAAGIRLAYVAVGIPAVVGAPRLLLLLLLGLVGEGELRVADASRVKAVVDGLALDEILERHDVGHAVMHKRSLHEPLCSLHRTSQRAHLTRKTRSSPSATQQPFRVHGTAKSPCALKLGYNFKVQK